MTPTHYAVLSLPQSLQQSHQSYQTLLKRAYHRTLLRCHPDKLPAGITAKPPSTHHDGRTNPTEIYTIDQINTAYQILSSPSSRQAYDASLRLQQQQLAPGSGSATATERVDAYRAGGLDLVDLDDMVYRSDDGPNGQCGRYTRPCRCGAEEGYVLSEDEMDEVEREVQLQMNGAGTGTGTTTQSRSMIVGCLGCSLWVQVDWAVCEDDEEES